MFLGFWTEAVPLLYMPETNMGYKTDPPQKSFRRPIIKGIVQRNPCNTLMDIQISCHRDNFNQKSTIALWLKNSYLLLTIL